MLSVKHYFALGPPGGPRQPKLPILEQTLGETIKEAWRHSLMHRRLKEVLSRDRIPKAEQIAQRLKRRIRGPRRLKELSLSARVEVSEAGEISRIAVTVAAQRETQLPPKLSVVLSKDGN